MRASRIENRPYAMNGMLKTVAVCALALGVVSCGVGNSGGTPADASKVLRISFPVAETGFDAQAISDLYSSDVMRAILEPLYAMDYLARPAKFVPSTAEALPEITDGGKTYTIKIKKGIYYAPDPAFKGQKRELIADDYVFAFKRVFDPKIISPRLSDFQEFGFLGADELWENAKKTGAIDFDAPVEGIRALDRHTLQLKLKQADPLLMQWLGFYVMSPVAREVYEAYKDISNKLTANPVGTGPYYLKTDEWKRGSKIVLLANPYFRGLSFATTSTDPADAPLIAQMKGKTLPAIGRIEISIIEESNPRLLAFKGKTTDIVNVPVDMVDNVVPGMKLVPELESQNVIWQRVLQPALSYTYFNMEDPVIGGYSKERIALRRALVMAFDTDEYVRLVWRGHAAPASQLIPPPMIGHDKSLKNRSKYDPETAKALLDKFGYVDKDGDGWRETPEGKPLLITFSSTPAARDREIDEFWKKSLDSIGVKVDFYKQKWPDLLKQAKAKQLQAWQVGWISALPDGSTFPSLLYSPKIGQANYSNFKNDEFDASFVKARYMEDTPARVAEMRKLTEMANAYSVWENGIFRYENTLVHPWVQGYKKNAFMGNPWWMYDIDISKRPKT
jgi:oligopeptide transport system substrate-binding protein